MEPGSNLDASAKNNYWGIVGMSYHICALPVVLGRAADIEITI